MELRAQSPYDFRAVIFSHGWADLLPFQVLDTSGRVRFAVRTSKGPVSVEAEPAKNGIRLRGASTKEVEAVCRRIFRLDDDLEDFYSSAESHGRPWIVERRMGRLLRSQTVFEDLIKLILTTNCTWEFTRVMVDRLARALGETTSDGIRLFPSAEKFASKTEKFYREKIRTGYRSPHFRTIAKAVLSGRLDCERWLDPAVSTSVVRKEILSVPGAGPYVADNLLRFLGRYDYLGLDTWARKKLKEIYRNPRLTDRSIAKKYQPFGVHRGLILWCDLTRDWLENDDFSSWIRTETGLDGGLAGSVQ